MIMTGEAAKFAEDFEDLDEAIQKEGFELLELDESAQIDLFQIMAMSTKKLFDVMENLVKL